MKTLLVLELVEPHNVRVIERAGQPYLIDQIVFCRIRVSVQRQRVRMDSSE